MRGEWLETEPRAHRATAHYSDELLDRQSAPVAVFDHVGKLVFANPAFAASPLAAGLLDRRRLIAAPEIERLRLELLREGSEKRGARFEVSGNAIWLEVLRLHSVAGWTGITCHPSPPPGPPAGDTPSLRLMLHELRAPLLALSQGIEELSQASSTASAQVREVTDRQARAVVRLRGVIQGVSDLIRAEDSGDGAPPLEKVGLAQVVGDVEDTYELLAAADGHTLEVDVETPGPTVRGDRDLIGRAVGNLVDNAIRHTPPGPVWIRVQTRGSLAVVEVSDQGEGISVADRDRIFQPFVRLRGASAGGSGLGLALVQRVADRHGASVTVDDRPGGGTVFRLAFLTGGVKPGPVPWGPDRLR